MPLFSITSQLRFVPKIVIRSFQMISQLCFPIYIRGAGGLREAVRQVLARPDAANEPCFCSTLPWPAGLRRLNYDPWVPSRALRRLAAPAIPQHTRLAHLPNKVKRISARLPAERQAGAGFSTTRCIRIYNYHPRTKEESHVTRCTTIWDFPRQVFNRLALPRPDLAMFCCALNVGSDTPQARHNLIIGRRRNM